MATKTKTTDLASEVGFDIEAVPEEHREQVRSMIPSPNVYEAYTHRHIAGHKDFDIFKIAHEMRHNVLFVGPTGAGKTTAGRAYAAYMGLPFASVEFNGAMDPAAVIGGNQVNPETGLPEWKWGELSLVTLYGGIGMLDEVNFAPARFTASFHGVLDARQTQYVVELGRRIHKHPATLIFGAYNPRYIGTNLLNEAFTNRWAFTLDWGYDSEVEDERVGQYSPTLLGRVREMRADQDVQGDIGTNAMEEFIHIAHALDINVAIEMFLGKLAPEDRGVASRVFEAERYVIADELGCDTGDDDEPEDEVA